MLSRSAQGLYWLSRYLERARFVCRLLASQFEAFEDSQIEEIDANWRRIYQTMARQPFGGPLELGDDEEDFMLTDSFTLADDWTFEPANPDSIRNCIGAARENARQVRNVIGANLWSCLNAAYLDIADLGLESIWNNHPREFFRTTSDVLQTVSGINDSTCYRDHSWHFMQLGKFVERSQLIAGIVHTQLTMYSTSSRNNQSFWRSLLQNCEARVAYHRLYSLSYQPKLVVDFLVCDPLLSHSVRYAVSEIEAALEAVAQGQSHLATESVNARTKELLHLIDHEWSGRATGDEAMRDMLSEIALQCAALHGVIESSYFNYDVESALPT